MVKNWREWKADTRMELEKAINENESHRETKEDIVKEVDEDDTPSQDMIKNPKNYYIWRSKSDDKVRISHAERDGKVFCWENPPEGGHPGEDYNCRCVAEEYKYAEGELKSKRYYDNMVLSVASALMQGVSLGYADEIHGIMSGLGYGGASLNSKWNKKEESFTEAYKRGYEKFRDNHRNILNDGYEKHSVLMTLSEATGAISSPVGLIFGATKTAPLAIKSKRDLIGNLVGGIAYGIGVSDGDVMDYISNIIAGVSGGAVGHITSKQLFGRGATPIAREFVNQFSNTVVNGFKNLIDKYK